MNLYPEYRHNRRFKHISIVTLEDRQQGDFIYGQIKNMSPDGMCLELDYAIKPGTLLDITIDKLPYKSDHKKYRALVKWCDFIDDDEAMYTYEIGIEFLLSGKRIE